MNLIQFIGALELGLLYGLIAMGVYLSFRVLDFPDLTVDGSFPLGAAVLASLILQGWSPLLATLLATLAGALAGLCTGYLHVRFKILGLLAGILSMTALYSINLRIMNSPNLALLDEVTLFTGIPLLLGLSCVTLILAFCLIYFLYTQTGLAMRAAGTNPRVSQAYGVNVARMQLLGLALSNAFVALAGALFVQSQGFADISMGAGTIVVGLASVIIGETLCPSRKLYAAIISVIVGSIVYRCVIAFALNSTDLGLKASDLNLITAALVALTMIVPKLGKRMRPGKI
jgi:putative tryptophan/tyrosine transport system permease protein